MNKFDWNDLPIYTNDGCKVTSFLHHADINVTDITWIDKNGDQRSKCIWTDSGCIIAKYNDKYNQDKYRSSFYVVGNSEKMNMVDKMTDLELADRIRQNNQANIKISEELANRGYTVKDEDGYALEFVLVGAISKTVSI